MGVGALRDCSTRASGYDLCGVKFRNCHIQAGVKTCEAALSPKRAVPQTNKKRHESRLKCMK